MARPRQRLLWLGVTAALSAAPVPAADAEPPRPIVVLASDGSAPFAEASEGFREAWAKLGEAPLEMRVLGDTAAAPALLAELERRPPAALVTFGTPAAREVGAKLAIVPLVAGLVADPAVVGTHPRASVLVTDFALETQVEWMRRLLPGRRTIGVVYSPEANGATIADARRAFEVAGLSLIAEPVRSPGELPLALRNLSRRADVIWGLADPMVVSAETAKALLLFSYQNRIPLAGLSTSWARAGAVYALDRDYRDLGRQCAELVPKTQQRSAGPLVRATPRRVRYALNLRAAEHMRVEFDRTLRRDASETFE